MLATWARLFPISLRQIFLAAAELGDQALIALGLLQRREIPALHVLDQRHLEHFAVGERALQHRHLVQAGELCRAPAPLAGDDFVAVGLGRMPAHQDRLEDAVGADRGGEGFELVLVEPAPRLQRARLQLLDRQLARRARRRGLRTFAQQRREAAPEAALLLADHGAGSVVGELSGGTCGGMSGSAGSGPRARRRISPARWM